MIIRRGKMSDAKELLEVLQNTPQLQGSEDVFYTMDFVKASLDSEKDLVLIADDNGKIAGFIMAEVWKDKKYSFLNDIFVKEEYRKKGVATLLFKEWEKICRKHKLSNINMLVLTDNEAMQKWCNKNGIKRGHALYLYEKKL